jgi:Protein of unknown function (DUF551)
MEGNKRMKKRILTIEVEIEDKEKSAWIWDNHMNNGGSNGVYVSSIRSGPIPEIENTSSWISVEERKPPNDVYVLVCKRRRCKDESVLVSVEIASRMNDSWINDHNGEILAPKWGIVTHWMPLPDKTEGE